MQSMDWEKYERVMDERLQRSVLACASGESGIPLDVAMQRLRQQSAVRREARAG
jgi:hypothetical protein